MNPRTRRQRIVALLLVVTLALCRNALAGPAYTYSRDFRLPIPADPDVSRGWMEDAVIEIPDHLTISDLDVGITLEHTNLFDVQLFLESPVGTVICLNMYDFKHEFSVDPNYTNTIFDDEAPVSIKEGQAPFTGRFRPIEPYELSEFDGQDTYGLWRLQICDAFWADIGTLHNFQLIVTLPDPLAVEPCRAVNVGQTSATLCAMVNNDGGQACQYRFHYRKQGGAHNSVTPWSSDTRTTGASFSQHIGGLTPGCKYCFWAEARNSAGEGAGSIECFTTLCSLLQLEAPNGGNTVLAGSRCLICWKADPNVTGDVLIEYSADNGGSWSIIGTAPNRDEWRSYTGAHYSWYPPAVTSDECLIRISDATDPTIFDVSANTFSIAIPAVPDVLGLAQPDAQAAIAAAGLAVGTITYVYGDAVPEGEVMGQYPEAGAPAAGSAVDLVVSAGQYAAAPPAVDTEYAVNIGTGSATLRGLITDDGGGCCRYRFWYHEEGGDHYDVTPWSSQFKTAGESFSQDIDGLTPGTKYYFWAQASNSEGKSDRWPRSRSITTLPGLLQLQGPNGGTYRAGGRCLICWKADPAVSEVLLEYSTDNGDSWNVIGIVANRDAWRSHRGGYYSWYPPAASSDECLVRISDTADPTIFDISDGTFTILQ